MEDLQSHIDEAAQAPVLIVASDYDGTLAPIVDDPDQAEIHREALVALKSLAETSQTQVAIISGRSLSDLGPHLKGLKRTHLVGSHGGEFEVGYAAHLDSKMPHCFKKRKKPLGEFRKPRRERGSSKNPRQSPFIFETPTRTRAQRPRMSCSIHSAAKRVCTPATEKRFWN